MAVPSPLRQLFDYLPPPGLRAAQVPVGVRVRAPIGSRDSVGVVVEHADRPTVGAARLKAIRLLIDEGVNTFVEVGPGRVLTGILRQIERSAATLNVEDEKSLSATVEKIAGARSDAA